MCKSIQERVRIEPAPEIAVGLLIGFARNNIRRACANADSPEPSLLAYMKYGYDKYSHKVLDYLVPLNGARWLSGGVLDTRLRGCRFKPH